MNIQIWKDNQQQGPFTEEELREHLASGRFAESDLAWTEGQADWKPLHEVLRPGSQPPPPPPKAASAEGLPKESAAENKSGAKSFGKDLWEKASVTARLTQKQAYRQKLELVELRLADHRIGKKAYENGLPLPSQAGVVAQLNELKEKMATLRAATDGNAVSFTDKARAAANAAARSAKLEAFALQQSHLLTELGSRLRHASQNEPALAAELEAANTISNQIEALDAEINSLSSKTYRWARQPLWIAAAVVIIGAAWVGNGMLKKSSQQRKFEQQKEMVKAQVDAYQATIAAQLQGIHQRQAEANARGEELRRQQQKKPMPLAEKTPNNTATPTPTKEPPTKTMVAAFIEGPSTLTGADSLFKKLEVSNAASGMRAGQGFSPDGIVFGSDGALYGFSIYGGRNDHGFLFRVDPDLNDFTVIYSFQDGEPNPRFIVAGADNSIYVGGKSGVSKDIIMRYSIADQTVTRENYLPDPGWPIKDTALFRRLRKCYYSELRAVLSDHTLIFTSDDGRRVFRSNINGKVEDFREFDNTKDWETLLADDDGYLYGTTPDSVVRIKADGSELSTLHQFEGMDEPVGSPVLLKGGSLFGYARHGKGGSGAYIYRVNRDGSGYATVLPLISEDTPAQQMSPKDPNPEGAIASDGKAIYATTANGLFMISSEHPEPQPVALLDQKQMKAIAEPKNILVTEKAAYVQAGSYLYRIQRASAEIIADAKNKEAQEQAALRETAKQEEQATKQAEIAAKDAQAEEDKKRAEADLLANKAQADLAQKRQQEEEKENEEQELRKSRVMKPYGPKTKHVVTIVPVGSRQAIAIDGEVGKGYREVVDMSNQLAARVYLRDGDVSHLIDSSSRPLFFSPAISADDQRVAYAARNEESKFVVVVDGKEGPAYDGIKFLCFAPVGNRLVYVGFRDKKFFVVDDGRESVSYEWLEARELRISPNGDHLAYIIRGSVSDPRDSSDRVVVDGKTEAAYGNVRGLAFSAVSKHYSYVGNVQNKDQLVIDGKLIGGTYENIGALVMDAECDHIAFVVGDSNSRSFNVVTDGKLGAEFGAIGGPTISPDGKRIVYVGSKNENGLNVSYVVENGVLGRGYEMCTTPLFSADSKHLIYIAQANRAFFLITDGKEGGPYATLQEAQAHVPATKPE